MDSGFGGEINFYYAQNINGPKIQYKLCANVTNGIHIAGRLRHVCFIMHTWAGYLFNNASQSTSRTNRVSRTGAKRCFQKTFISSTQLCVLHYLDASQMSLRCLFHLIFIIFISHIQSHHLNQVFLLLLGCLCCYTQLKILNIKQDGFLHTLLFC